MKKKYVYFFGGGKAEGNGKMKSLLGGKGAGLAEMSRIGLPVPPGFTITTEVCAAYYKRGRKYPPQLKAEVEANLRKLEKLTGKKLGSIKNPLLVSVRSGAAISMPGMMDTILNLGLNDKSVEALGSLTKNLRFAWDSYRRFIQMFGDVVMNVPHAKFEHELEEIKREIASRRGISRAQKLKQEELNRAVPDTDLGVEDLKNLVNRYKKIFHKATGRSFPQDPQEQLWLAIGAVFGSWNNERAIAYRQINEIKGLLGTAVNVQTMVFGNMGDDSGTGVGFTRNPSTGENKLYGEFLMNAQGEDVVAGIRTPLPLERLKKENVRVYNQLQQVRRKLEKHYRDMQDFEFTIEKGKLYMLQTRTGKRTAQAAVKIAVDMVKEKLINEKEAILRIEPKQIDQLLHPMFDSKEENRASSEGKVFSRAGLPASPGAAVGQVVFSAEEAEAWKKKGRQVILCRIETSPEDIKGMNAAEGILTVRGGMTSHAAVVARGMGKCCVAGAGDIVIEEAKRMMKSGDKVVKEGDWVSLNGSRGIVYIGKISLVPPQLSGPFATVMKWADKFRKLGVRTNADTPYDAAVAVKFGAEGVGLCRTEHMFFSGRRIVSFRKMILAAPKFRALSETLKRGGDSEEKKELEEELKKQKKQLDEALAELLPLQREDFEGIFTALKGRPCTIRLLDPPLHEFLPHDEEGQKELAKSMGLTWQEVKDTVDSLKELNPMLGHRGCRLGISYPQITAMQTRAIIEAALNVAKKKVKVKPEIMVPLVGNVKELKLQKEVILNTIEEVKKEKHIKKLPFSVAVGTMIEVPRAAVTADEIAQEAEFFSFGTNDLTQMGCGFSRDDAGKFLQEYVDLGIYDTDPFQSLDTQGVGRLIETACRLGRKGRPNLKLGICGEHGGDPKSILFCHKVGLNYVSCSPYRVPIARLAAAGANIKSR
ncbi:MAG: pyruvate, phosphate dikinase [Candidatus Omnitrophica bacterium]|nr:pyruvate, phosphate dikinase [Candidatus Omnitrophota bacterium]